MGSLIKALTEDLESRRKGVVQRAKSRRDPNPINVKSTKLKKDREKSKTHQNTQDSSRNSVDIAKQIDQNDKTNRHSISSSIISQPENNARSSTLLKKSTAAPINNEMPVNSIKIDEKKQEKSGKRQCVDTSNQMNKSSLSEEKPATSTDFESGSFFSAPPQQQNSVEIPNFPKNSDKIDNDPEPTGLIKHETQRVENLQDKEVEAEPLGRDDKIESTTELLETQNKTYFDSLQLSDVSDPHSFVHVSGYTLLESEWRSGNIPIERSEITHDQNSVPKNVIQQEVVEKTAGKVKTEKKIKVKRGDVSEPITPQHPTGFSKLGVSREKFDVDNFLHDKNLQRQMGLLDNEEKDTSTPNFKKDFIRENATDSNKKQTKNKKNKKTRNPEELSNSDRLENSSGKEHLEKLEGTPELKNKIQEGTLKKLKKKDIGDPYQFEHVSGHTKHDEKGSAIGLNMAEDNVRLHEDVDGQQADTAKNSEEFHDTRLEKTQKLKKTTKKKTGKLKMSEISDPVNFEHVSGYTKVDEKSENELSDDTIMSDDDVSRGQNKKEKEIGLRNDEMAGLVKNEIAEENTSNGNEVSGFPTLGVSVENLDVGKYSDKTEGFTQSVPKEMAITEGNLETETLADTSAGT